MFCSRCGKTIPGTSKFCPYCGASVSPATPPVSHPNAYSPFTRTQPSYSHPPYTQPLVKNQASKVRYTNSIALLGVAAFVLSLFLPFLTVSGMGERQSASFINLFAPDSPLAVMILLLLCMAVILILQVAKAPQPATIVMAVLSLILLLIFAGIINSTIQDAASAYQDNATTLFYYGITDVDISFSFSFGFWLMLLSHIVILFSSPLHKAIAKNKGGF